MFKRIASAAILLAKLSTASAEAPELTEEIGAAVSLQLQQVLSSPV